MRQNTINRIHERSRLIQLLSSVAVMPGNVEAKRFRMMSELCLDLHANILISHTLNLAQTEDGKAGKPSICRHSDIQGWPPLPRTLLDTELSDLSDILDDLTDSLLHPQTDGLNSLGRIKIFSPTAGLIFLSDHSNNRLKYHAIVRLDDRRPFMDAEIQYAHNFTSRVPWLFREPSYTFLDSEVEQLSPRLKSVLILMLEGENRQTIADDLGLSVHTVNSYFKELFPYFKVNSHLQLIQKMHQLNRTSPMLASDAYNS